MPTVQDQDLNYQPTTNPYSYSPPKVSIFKKIFYFLKNIFSIKTLFTESKLFFIIIIPFILFAFALIIINYFNVLSLSYLYPKFFDFLPHRYDVVANNAALSGVPYSKDIEGYQISGTFYKIKADGIIILYKGKAAEFMLDNRLSCSQKVTTQISKTEKESVYRVTFCSEILDNKNIGKKISATFYKTSSDSNMINYLFLE